LIDLTMTSHPMHLHGHEFTITGTDGGPTPKSTRWPEVTRREQKPRDYSNPEWFKHPPGTNAFEWTGSLAEPARFKAEGGSSMPSKAKPAKDIEVKARKPNGHSGH